VVLATPLHRFGDIDPASLDGKLVVDAMNYWPVSVGVLEPFEDRGSSEVVARRLAGLAVVKALNHIGYHELEDRARPPGAPDRRAVAGDDSTSRPPRAERCFSAWPEFSPGAGLDRRVEEVRHLQQGGA